MKGVVMTCMIIWCLLLFVVLATVRNQPLPTAA